MKRKEKGLLSGRCKIVQVSGKAVRILANIRREKRSLRLLVAVGRDLEISAAACGLDQPAVCASLRALCLEHRIPGDTLVKGF